MSINALLKNPKHKFYLFLTISIIFFTLAMLISNLKVSAINKAAYESISTISYNTIYEQLFVILLFIIYIAIVCTYFYFNMTGFFKFTLPIILFETGAFFYFWFILEIATSNSLAGIVVVILFIPFIIAIIVSFLIGFALDKGLKSR